MATRNERKRKAAARKAELEAAVEEAFRLEAERKERAERLDFLYRYGRAGVKNVSSQTHAFRYTNGGAGWRKFSKGAA